MLAYGSAPKEFAAPNQPAIIPNTRSFLIQFFKFLDFGVPAIASLPGMAAELCCAGMSRPPYMLIPHNPKPQTPDSKPTSYTFADGVLARSLTMPEPTEKSTPYTNPPDSSSPEMTSGRFNPSHQRFRRASLLPISGASRCWKFRLECDDGCASARSRPEISGWYLTQRFPDRRFRGIPALQSVSLYGSR